MVKMFTPLLQLLNVVFLLLTKLIICTEYPETAELEFSVTDQALTEPLRLEYSHVHLSNHGESNAMADSGQFYSFIPLVSNVVVTGQDPFKLEVSESENGEFFSQQVPLSEDISLDYNLTQNDNCSTNVSCTMVYLRAPTFQQSALTRVIVLLCIAIFSLVGNIATLSSILRTGRQGTSTVYMLLVQLAIADLLVSIFCILADALWTLSVQWYGGNFLCKAVKFMQLFSLYLSTFLLVLIGFDRLCAVRFPMRRARAKHHVRTGIVCVWSLSAVFSLPQVFIFSVMRGPFVEDFYQCVTFGFYTAHWQEQLYTTLSLVLMFLLPLAVLVATYVATFLAIARQENMFSERACRSAIDNARQKILHKAKIKSLMITVVIVLTFVICWAPYYVTMIIFIFLDPSEQLSQDLQKAIFFFGSSTAAINPLIYGAFHLRPRRRRRSKSTLSLGNHSTSSRIDNSHFIFKKSHMRKSREESIALHINGELLNHTTSLYKQRYSSVTNISNSKIVRHNSNQY